MRAPNICMTLALAVFAIITAIYEPACKDVASAENGAITVEQYACMTADLAEEVTTGEVQAVAQALAKACGVAPALITTIETIVTDFAANKAALEVKRQAGEPPPLDGMWITIVPVAPSAAAPAPHLH